MVMQDRMRLISTMYEEDVLEAYRKSQRVMNRSQLDGRNSDASPSDFYELAAAKFNDPTWKATSKSLPTLHAAFEDPVDWPKREEYTINRDKIKAIFSWEKQKLNRIIRDYGRSGAGAGELDDDEQIEDGDSTGSGPQYWGHFDLDLAKTNGGGDDRGSFLKGDPPDVLYWWHVLDELDLLQMTCVKFNQNLAASSDQKVGSVSSTTKKKQRSPNDSQGSTTTMHAEVLSSSIDHNTATMNIMSLRRTIATYQKELTKVQGDRFSERAMQIPEYGLF
eukprot:scaffold945_cov82-Cylindrotheca_fusiformis.AAC.10